MLREDFPRPNFIRPRWKPLNGEWLYFANPPEDFDVLSSKYDKKVILPKQPEDISSTMNKYNDTKTHTEDTGSTTNKYNDTKPHTEDTGSTTNKYNDTKSHTGDIDNHIESNVVADSETNSLTVNSIPEETNVQGFSDIVFYKKRFLLTQAESVGSIFFCCSSVDGDVQVYVNGNFVGQRKGAIGFISIDISKQAIEGSNEIAIFVMKDPLFDSNYVKQPCIIGQVWLEFTASTYLDNIVIRNSVSNSSFYLYGDIINYKDNMKIDVEISTPSNKIINFSYNATKKLNIQMPIPAPIALWKILDGSIYNLKVTLTNSLGGSCDTFYSYAAFCDLQTKGGSILLNNSVVFFKHVVDDFMTAEKQNNITLLKEHLATVIALGYNGVRPVGFTPSPQYLYIANKLGLTVHSTLIPEGLFSHSDDAAKLVQACINSNITASIGFPCIVLWSPYIAFDAGLEFTEYILSNFKKACPSLLLATYNRTKLEGAILTKDLSFSTKDEVYRDIINHLSEAASVEIPLHYNSIYLGELLGAYASRDSDEQTFIEKYEFITGILLTKFASGFTYISYADSLSQKSGIVNADGNYKLSKSSLDKLREINKRRSMAELAPILNKQGTEKPPENLS